MAPKMKSLDAELKALELAAGSTALAKKKESRMAKRAEVEARLERFVEAVKNKESKAHRVAIDFGGGFLAQVSTEALNWGIRGLARWSKNGFWANNVDLLQGAPHFVIGMALYFIEMLTRKDPKETQSGWVTPTREIISEMTKIFAQLGFSNLARAVRIRWGDAKDSGVQIAALQAEKQALEARLAAMNGQGSP